MATSTFRRIAAVAAAAITIATAAARPASANDASGHEHLFAQGTELGNWGGGANCGSGQVMVGIRGSADWYVDGVISVCVGVSNGSWSGSVTDRGLIGHWSGASYERICPENHAVAGFKGKAGRWFDSLSIGCRPLSATFGRVTSASTITWLPRVGGDGGRAFGPLQCTANRAVTGMHGRWSWYVNMVKMHCAP